jgi:hypothetical protein
MKYLPSKHKTLGMIPQQGVGRTEWSMGRQQGQNNIFSDKKMYTNSQYSNTVMVVYHLYP